MNEETDGLEAAPADAAPAADAAQVDTLTSEATTGTDGADIPEAGDESAADADGEPKKPAKGVQKRLDELTRRIHEERREKERLLTLLERGGPGQQQPNQAPVAQTAPPREDQFATYEEFEQARIDYAVEQRLQTVRQLEQRDQAARTFEERVTKVRDKLPDFDLYVGDPTLPITPLMATVIRESDVGPEVAYHLGKNRSEAQRIADLSPHRQAAELGRLEAKLSMPAAPNPKPIPPAPPQTVSGISAGLSKSPDEMSMAEYVEWQRARDKT